MSREIKFRIWDTENKIMSYQDGEWELDNRDYEFIWFPFNITSNNRNEAILLQFTGLTDKNGKEIYENDLVRDQNGNIAEIVWNERRNGWDYKHKTFPGLETLREFEVIGNVYENPELL